jgi:hypothetical protein|tara:strand:- start:12791 stop:13237 length:447 start_codon:yes stop_codon:yes gene_type:complete
MVNNNQGKAIIEWMKLLVAVAIPILGFVVHSEIRFVQHNADLKILTNDVSILKLKFKEFMESGAIGKDDFNKVIASLEAHKGDRGHSGIVHELKGMRKQIDFIQNILDTHTSAGIDGVAHPQGLILTLKNIQKDVGLLQASIIELKNK